MNEKKKKVYNASWECSSVENKAQRIIVTGHKIHGKLESLEDRETSPVLEGGVKFDQFVAVGLIE